MFLPETEDFKTLLDAAFAAWAPGAKVSYKRLRGGRSGAVVMKVDIRGLAKVVWRIGSGTKRLISSSKIFRPFVSRGSSLFDT